MTTPEQLVGRLYGSKLSPRGRRLDQSSDGNPWEWIKRNRLDEINWIEACRL